jgi:hypothetical protein
MNGKKKMRKKKNAGKLQSVHISNSKTQDARDEVKDTKEFIIYDIRIHIEGTGSY